MERAVGPNHALIFTNVKNKQLKSNLTGRNLKEGKIIEKHILCVHHMCTLCFRGELCNVSTENGDKCFVIRIANFVLFFNRVCALMGVPSFCTSLLPL